MLLVWEVVGHTIVVELCVIMQESCSAYRALAPTGYSQAFVGQCQLGIQPATCVVHRGEVHRVAWTYTMLPLLVGIPGGALADSC